MKLPIELLLLIPSALAAPLAPRSATLPHLRGLSPLAHDLSTTDGRHPDKYFHEAVFHPHYDGRFAATVLPHKTRLFHMRLLLRSYMAAMRRAGVRTWLMHGSLLAWWWGGGMFPWDSDLDVCVDEVGMGELGAWWNMSVHAFTASELGLLKHDSSATLSPWALPSTEPNAPDPLRESPGLADGTWQHVLLVGKKYLLEINPHATVPSTDDTHNVIDARWIDTATGLFIDITTVHAVPQPPPHTQTQTPPSPPEEMYTKDTHLYTTTSLFPLRTARFEGVSVAVPYAYETLLLEEYGPRALTERAFNGYEFRREGREWVVATGGSTAAGGSTPETSHNLKATGRGAKASKRPSGKAGAAAEGKARDNRAGVVYTPVAGREGDVHVVPGSG